MAYKYTPINSRVHIVGSENQNSYPSANPTTPTKLSGSNILQ